MDFPSYSYADEIATPRELGVKRDGSFAGIERAVAGVNYYGDVIGFGETTNLAKDSGMKQKPLGIRFFTKTGVLCSNGANMYEYIDTIPKGIKGRVGDELKKMDMPNMRGLAPGIMEDAMSALNPMPFLEAAVGSGYAKCKKITEPVGDFDGRIESSFNGEKWIKDPVKRQGGRAYQSRWVFESWISKEEYEATPKTETPDGAVSEGFQDGKATISIKTSQAAAVMLGALLIGAIILTRS
jgi:hypothetical protein